MKNIISALCSALCILFAFGSARAQDAQNIIPQPNSVEYTKGSSVIINSKSTISYDPVFEPQAILLQEAIKKQTNIAVRLSKGVSDRSTINLRIDNSESAKIEGYQLTASGNRIEIAAPSTRGMVYGMHTLTQLIPTTATKSVAIRPVTITDAPRFAYRGMHLDVVRHLFPIDFVKRYIDYLSFHKLNTLHWHLNDDQGWRIEILSYPKLNSIGSWRDETLIGHFRDQPIRYDGTPYGGYYTRTEIKEVIAYAKVRGIDVIPEIDIPGHNRATIAAYPELSTNRDTTWQVATTWGMFNRQNNVLAPSPETFRFLEAIFSEVADLFESEYIHLGGDECSKMWWEQTPWVQDFIKENNLKDESGLQTYFITESARHIKAKGKKVIGWDEIIEGELDASTIIMNWHKPEKAIVSAKRNHEIIMCSNNPLYFNNAQSREPQEILAKGYNPLEAVYKFDIVPQEIVDNGLEHLVIGGQACVWTEYIKTPQEVEYMLFPRMTALSEVLWSRPNQLDFNDFKLRLKNNMIPRYNFWKSNYFANYEKWDIEAGEREKEREALEAKEKETSIEQDKQVPPVDEEE